MPMIPVPGAHFLDAIDAEGKVRPHQRREVALALTDYAVGYGRGRTVGDPVFEAVTEGRQSGNEKRRAAGSPELPYSCCGDHEHWKLKCLGCTDESLVNRSDDDGEIPWRTGVNISRIVGAPGYVKATARNEPTPADTLFLRNSHGGHVCTLREWSPDEGYAITDDYGQPYAKRVRRKLARNSLGFWLLDGCPLDGWLDLDAVPLNGPARLPEAVESAL